jgi:gas vesicle protein
MADPALLTAIVGTAAGLIGAATPILFERRHGRKEREAGAEKDAKKLADSSIESWAALNKALNREIGRLHDDVDRIRSDYESAIARQRTEHETQLAGAHQRIADLEADVASLRRILSPDQGLGH